MLSIDDFIIYEDNHLLVINKPAGLLAQGDHTGQKSVVELAKHYLKHRYNKPGNVYVGLVHRLDRLTSGTMILTRTSKAASRLTRQFKNHDTHKFYTALVHKGTLENDLTRWHPLSHHLVRKRDVTFAYNNHVNGSQEGHLDYKILMKNEDFILLLIRLHTGRKHQIRAQFASIGCPVVGDERYGSQVQLSSPRIMLHAVMLYLTHPVKKEQISFVSPLPAEFTALSKINISMETIEEEIYSIISHQG